MVKKIIAVTFGALILSGCSLNLPVPGTSSTSGSIWKSENGGALFEPSSNIDDENKISSADVASFAFHPQDDKIMYIGTIGSGIFRTVDGAEHWEQIIFPPIKNYGLAIDKSNGDRIFASGVFDSIAKIYRTEDAGNEWKEVYTEPGKGTVITALVSHPNNPNTLYAGTSAGLIIKSTDGGETWKNMALMKGPITKIVFEENENDRVSLLVLGQGIVSSGNAGETWDDLTKIDTTRLPINTTSVITAPSTQPSNIITLADDPSQAGVLYVGAETGLFKSTDNGRSWVSLPIIESSKNFSIRAIAVNPRNSNEITYTSGRAFYKSTDGGTHWATTELKIDRDVSLIQYKSGQPSVIYFGLRKY